MVPTNIANLVKENGSSSSQENEKVSSDPDTDQVNKESIFGLIGEGLRSRVEERKRPWYQKKYQEKKKEWLEYLEEASEQGIAQVFIVSRRNRLYKCWEVIITILCLISAYIYANIAAFRMHPVRDERHINDIYAAFESLFLFDMVLQFFVEFVPEGQTRPIRNLERIAMNYFRNDFLLDFIAILPLELLEFKNHRQ